MNIEPSASPDLRRGLPDNPAWKEREDSLDRASRFLRAIAEINRLIIRADNAEELLRATCEILAAQGGYRRAAATMLTPEHRPGRTFGRDPGRPSKSLRPCAARALANRRSLVILDTAKASTCRTCDRQDRGWAACFMIGCQEHVYGILHVVDGAAGDNPAQEITFLEETAGNLGRALHGLRERQEREAIAEELRALKEFSEHIVRDLAEGIIIENARGIITFANPTIERLIGYDPGEIIGRHWRTIVSAPEIPSISRRMKARRMAAQEKYESVLKAKDGRLVPVLISARPVEIEGRFSSVLTAVSDIRDLKDIEDRLRESQKKLTELAMKDGLTGQWNRTTIFKFLADELSRGAREAKPTSVIMIDVDDFKIINDAFGHLAGDRVLAAMTASLEKHLRRTDKIGRYGGDEVLLVLPHCDLAKAAAIAERVRTACEKAVLWVSGRPIQYTLSLGCASSQAFARPTIDKMIRAADRALYQAKRDGRNRVAAA